MTISWKTVGWLYTALWIAVIVFCALFWTAKWYWELTAYVVLSLFAPSIFDLVRRDSRSSLRDGSNGVDRETHSPTPRGQ